MKLSITNHIFGSKLLDAREKWMIVRYIKQNNPSDEQVRGILSTLSKEEDYKKQSKLESIRQWNESLSKLVHGALKQKKDEENRQIKDQDNAQADDMLSNYFD